MKFCKIPIWLAYLALLYIFASIYYLIVTRNFGTPFRNAVNRYPELIKIKYASVSKRKNAFYKGIIIGLCVLAISQPFSSCL